MLILYNWSYYTEKPSWPIKSLYYELLSFKCNFQVHVFEFTLFRPNFVISIFHFLLWTPPNIDYNNFEYFNYMIFLLYYIHSWLKSNWTNNLHLVRIIYYKFWIFYLWSYTDMPNQINFDNPIIIFKRLP